MNKHLAVNFIKHFLLSTDVHGLQSPFFTRFYTQCISNKLIKVKLPDIEKLHADLLKNKNSVEVTDFGAGSNSLNTKNRLVSAIAKTATTPPSFSKILHRIIKHYEFKHIVELGTSLGLNALYLAKAHEHALINTFEGCPNLANLANEHFQKLKTSNIQLNVGNIDNTLPAFLRDNPTSIDLVYIDANHTYEATLRYFESLLPHCHHNSIIVIDDIYWSKEMSATWDAIKNHQACISSLDIFEAGFVFLNPELNPIHLKLWHYW